MSCSDNEFVISTHYRLGYGEAKLEAQNTRKIKLRCCAIVELLDAVEALRGDDITLEFEPGIITLTGKGTRKTQVRLTPKDLPEHEKLDQSGTSVDFNEASIAKLVKLVKMFTVASPALGILCTSDDAIAVNERGTQIVYEDIPCLAASDDSDVTLSPKYLKMLSDMAPVQSISAFKQRIVVQAGEYSELNVCIPMPAQQTRARCNSALRAVRQIAKIPEADRITVQIQRPTLIAEAKAGSKATSHVVVDPSTDVIISGDSAVLRIPTKFETKIDCKVDGLRDGENAEFGVNLRALANTLSLTQEDESGIAEIVLYRTGPAIIHIIMDSVHLLLGLENSSAGIRKVC